MFQVNLLFNLHVGIKAQAIAFAILLLFEWNAGMRKSHVHDIEITKEAPNYSRK